MINCCFYWDFEEANNAQQSAKRSEKLLGSDESEERKDEKNFIPSRDFPDSAASRQKEKSLKTREYLAEKPSQP